MIRETAETNIDSALYESQAYDRAKENPDDLFVLALDEGNFGWFQESMRNGARPKRLTKREAERMLGSAMYQGNPAKLAWSLENGADPNQQHRAPNYTGEPAWREVLRTPADTDAEMLRIFFLHGAKPDLTLVADGKRYSTALNKAIMNKRRDIVKVLLDNNARTDLAPDPVNAAGYRAFNELPPLIMAAAMKDEPIVKMLLRAGADPTITTLYNYSATTPSQTWDQFDAINKSVQDERAQKLRAEAGKGLKTAFVDLC